MRSKRLELPRAHVAADGTAWNQSEAADLPPSLKLRRTAEALAEAGQVGPRPADLKVRGYVWVGAVRRT